MTFPYAVNLRFKNRGTKKLTEDKLLLSKKFLIWITSKDAIIFFYLCDSEQRNPFLFASEPNQITLAVNVLMIKFFFS